MFWMVAAIILGFLFLILLIFMFVTDSKKDERIFKLAKRNIILQHKIERLIKDKEFETKQINRL